MADTHETDLKIKSDVEQAKKDVQSLISLYTQLDSLIDKVQRKAQRNNNHVSTKDTTNIRNMQQEVSERASNLNTQGQRIANNSRDSNVDTRKMANDFAKALKDTLGSIGFNPQTNGVGTSQKYQDLMHPHGAGSGLVENPNRNFLDNPNDATDITATNLRRQNVKTANELKNLSSDIHNNQGSARRTGDRVNTSLGSSKMTRERFNEYHSAFKETSKRTENYRDIVARYKRQNANNISDYSKRINDIDQRFKAGTATSNDSINRNQYAKQLQQEEKFGDKLEDLTRTLEKTDDVVKKSRENLSAGTGEGGNTRVLHDRDSFLGRLERRQDSINIAAATGVSSQIASGTRAGNTRRLQAEQYTDPITFNERQNGRMQDSKHPDRDVYNSLSRLGRTNGTGFTGAEMNQFAGAYTGTTGDTQNYRSGANAWSRFARYSGAGQQNTLALEQAIGEAGGGRNPANLSRIIQDNIAGSGMQGRVSDQVQGLTSYAQYAQGTGAGLSTRGMENLSALQGTMAKSGQANMQGQMGAQATQQLSQGLTNADDPAARVLMAQVNGSQRYTGVGGNFRMKLDMEKMQSNPGKLGKVIGAINSSSPDTDVAANRLQQMTGMAPSQAKKFIELQKQGKLSQKDLENFTKNNKGSSSSNKNTYDQNDASTLNDKNARQEQGQDYMSLASMPFNRMANAMIPGNHPVIGAMAQVMGVGALSGAGNKLAGLAMRSAGKGLGTLGRFGSRGIGSLLSKAGYSGVGGLFTKWGTKATAQAATEATEAATKNAGSGIAGEAVGGATTIGGSILAKGKGLLGRGKGLLKSGLSKGKGLFGRGTSVLRGSLEKTVDDGIKNNIGREAGDTFRTTTKVGRGLSKAGKLGRGLETAGKVGRLGKFVGPLDAVIGAMDFANAMGTTKKGTVKRHKKVGKSIGGTVGSVAGGAIGGAIGGVPGAFIGSAVGGWAGGKVGNWVGGLFNGRKNKGTKGEKTKAHKKSKTLLGSAKSLLKGFNDMLDKAMRVIAEAKSIKGGDSGGGSDSVDDVDSPDGSGVNRWKDSIKKVAKAMGQKVTDKNVKDILSLIKNESGGNEKVTQNSAVDDVNMRNGTPAQGLLQYVPSTFKNYAVKGHTNINSGIDQLYAFFNNSSWQSDLNPSGGWTPHGSRVKHARGGIYNTATMRSSKDLIAEDGTEAAVPLNAKHAQDGRNMLDKISPMLGRVSLDKNDISNLANNSTNFNPSVNVTVNVSGNANAGEVSNGVQQGVSKALQETMNKMTNYYGNALSPS